MVGIVELAPVAGEVEHFVTLLGSGKKTERSFGTFDVLVSVNISIVIFLVVYGVSVSRNEHSGCLSIEYQYLEWPDVPNSALEYVVHSYRDNA